MFNKISFIERLFFTKHLSIMLKSGITLPEALDSLKDEAKSPAFKKILTDVSADVQKGKSLKEALERSLKAFNSLYLSLIKIGERSGNLEKNLEHLSEQLEKEHNFRKKVQSAMLYPILVLSATAFLGGGIGLFILPKLVDFFEGLDVELPITTKILLFIAQIMKDYGMIIIPGFFVLLFLGSLFVRLKSVKPRWHYFLLRMPIIGAFIKCTQLSSFCRNLGIMLQSGIPITEALQISVDAISNEVFKTDVNKIAQAVEKGKSIESVLTKGKFFEFPSIVTKMIGVGEKTGRLEENLLYMGIFYEEELDDLSKNLSNVLEPIMLIGIGLVVGFVALAIISPIYELTGSMGR
ncbi:type II secretion system F family protein [Candidatus Microgenomates bacterium]|nr:type II secretion system F family protein [Candidatus Microgenomates bacterium]